MISKLLFPIFLALIFASCSNNEKLPEKCYEKGKSGMCRGYFIKYHYNLKKSKCEKYVYGGCGEFVFNTIEECQSSCEK